MYDVFKCCILEFFMSYVVDSGVCLDWILVLIDLFGLSKKDVIIFMCCLKEYFFCFFDKYIYVYGY